MFFEKASATPATYLGGADKKEKEKFCACIKKGNIGHCILVTHLVLLLFPIAGCTILDCQINTPAVTNSSVPLPIFQRCCTNASNGEVNISLASRWLDDPAGICTTLSWRGALQLPMCSNSSNVSMAIKCSELDNALKKLQNVSEFYSDFSYALSSFDCRQRYSVKKNCQQCLNAYKRWLCLVMFFTDGLKPCLDICYDVYRSCPAFQPDDSYGGYHVFECPKEDDSPSLYGPKSNCTTGCTSQIKNIGV